MSVLKYTTSTGAKVREADESSELTNARTRFWASLRKRVAYGPVVRIR